MADDTQKPPETPAKAKRPAVDSVPKGSTDLWPLLRLEGRELAQRIAAGECDGVLSELEEMAQGHPVQGPKGEAQPRTSVLDAIAARRARVTG